MQTVEQLDRAAKAEAKPYQGKFAVFTVAFGLAVLLAYLATLALVYTGKLPLAAGAVLLVLLTYMAYTVLHDAAHGSISGSKQSLRWVNEWLGYAAAWMLMIPLTAHRFEHLTHHRNTNDPEGDPDFVVSDMARSPFHAARAAVRVVAAQYSFYVRERWAKASAGQNLRFCLEVAAAVGLRAVILLQGDWLATGLILFAVGGIGGVMLVMYLFAYIVHRPHKAEGPYVDTSTIIAAPWCNGLVTWLWLFQNYHSIHHLFPRVPFYHYRKLFEQLEPIMVARGAPIYTLTARGLHVQPAFT
jgi:beta-carotene hydroxylase